MDHSEIIILKSKRCCLNLYLYFIPQLCTLVTLQCLIEILIWANLHFNAFAETCQVVELEVLTRILNEARIFSFKKYNMLLLLTVIVEISGVNHSFILKHEICGL